MKKEKRNQINSGEEEKKNNRSLGKEPEREKKECLQFCNFEDFNALYITQCSCNLSDIFFSISGRMWLNERKRARMTEDQRIISNTIRCQKINL